ncbi:MAG: response regulator transcription factor [Micrococcales bacterium]
MSEVVDYKRKIVLVEDDNLTRNILGQHLQNAGFEVVTAANASQAEIICAEFDPDAVVLDVDLGPGPTGFDLADSLRLSSPGIAILFLTHLPDSRFGGRSATSLPEGAAYLNKHQLADGSSLVKALDAVLRGLSSRIPRDDQDPGRPLATLSSSQISVLRMIALGMSNSQIAEERGTSTRAVYGLISRAMSSIGSDDDSEGAGRVLAARTYMLAAGIPLAN